MRQGVVLGTLVMAGEGPERPQARYPRSRVGLGSRALGRGRWGDCVCSASMRHLLCTRRWVGFITLVCSWQGQNPAKAPHKAAPHPGLDPPPPQGPSSAVPILQMHKCGESVRATGRTRPCSAPATPPGCLWWPCQTGTAPLCPGAQKTAAQRGKMSTCVTQDPGPLWGGAAAA